MDLSIIIVNWKSLEYLRSCISSIYRHTSGVDYEIIVIDNHSGDDSEHVIPAEFPNVLFISSKHNLGFAKANNTAYARSSGRVLLFLNPDTEVTNQALARMLAPFARHESLGAAGARLLNSDGSLQTSCIQAYPTVWNQILDSEFLRSLFPKCRLWGMAPLFSKHREPADVEVISGACLMVRRTVFEEVRFFTDSYFMYAEDVDLCYKISRAGYRLLYLPDCHVTHHGGQSSSKRGPSFANLCQKESFLHFFQNRRGRAYGWYYKLALAAVSAVRVLLIAVSIPLGPLVFRGKDRRALLHKWVDNFRWAIGFDPVTLK